jgi:hypothetical protein
VKQWATKKKKKNKEVRITYIGGEQQKKVRKGALSEPKSLRGRRKKRFERWVILLT